jgi:protein-S-isoprenylcysteine O-methyltransferase Ste14
MSELIERVAARSVHPEMFVAGMAAIYVTGLLLLVAAALKFLEHIRHSEPLSQKYAHFFSTREMLIGVLVLFPFWLNSIAQLPLAAGLARLYFALGAVSIFVAVVWHIAAKFTIRHMWSDGIEIKEQHQLMTSGAYALARHPMYASLLMWCWGASLMMANWASFLITTLVLLPLMIKRAKDEETALLKVQPDYFLYQQNAPMLTPKLKGAIGLAVRAAAVGLFAWLVMSGVTASGLMLLCAIHLYLSFCIAPAKVAFSYRSKTAMTVVVWALAQAWPPAYYLLYALLAMFVYGLRFNCPCMLVYERYHGCPCVGWVKSCLVKPR